MVTRIELIDRSLVRIGADPLGSETAPGADTHLACWDATVETVLSVHDWTCSSFLRQLSRRSEPPAAHWSYAFELPADMIGSPKALFDRPTKPRAPITDYELYGERELRANAETIWAKAPFNVAPNFWPGYLRELIVLYTMSELALSVREDRVLRDRLRGDAIGSGSLEWHGGLLETARNQNDMAKPSSVIGGTYNPVADARYLYGGGED